ncbi:heme ABC exporter ATP-binding protein CcmA [Novosphingobium sp. 9U]|uniref:heme ABC exporter ATP-binding protein CcmA n=1 Tax=Novosphingobium sp. 9U TaxID=2653158 RepID=UPI0012F088C0|nr:heme ABC exporter ATP-binding protein CcmA [Novosphingobium sp. 9U]VWX54691.1 Cytochrome c biogenesis ATP-binding export protein CcmA [Novosphingobium sp. 9U]
MQGAHIAAHELACRRGDRVLFRGLSFALGAGEALQVMGANGTGKSSLLRLVAGLARPFAGSVTRMGEVGLVDERPALDPELPLGRALAFWQGIDGHAPADPAALGLADLLDVPVRYLSTGQRKRAAMARLLGQHAAIWLLDEPLNGLDVHAALLVEQLAADHCANGGVLLIASHQPFTLTGMRTLDLAGHAPSAGHAT